MSRTHRIRIGIDTGGTFTDVVAVDELTGELAVTKTPSTPRDPAVGFMTGVHKVLEQLGLEAGSVSAVSHGTTVATNKLLEGKVENLGFLTNEGYEFMLEIARQSVPDGYGNSYFWVKPDRIVPAHRVKTVPGRVAVDGTEIRPFDAAAAAVQARWFRDQGINTIGVCFLHSYADDAHERAMRDVLAVEHPEATVSISSEVLREYREYERSVTTLVDAAVKPDIRRYVENIAGHLAAFTDSRPTLLSRPRSNGSRAGRTSWRPTGVPTTGQRIRWTTCSERWPRSAPVVVLAGRRRAQADRPALGEPVPPIPPAPSRRRRRRRPGTPPGALPRVGVVTRSRPRPAPMPAEPMSLQVAGRPPRVPPHTKAAPVIELVISRRAPEATEAGTPEPARTR